MKEASIPLRSVPMKRSKIFFIVYIAIGLIIILTMVFAFLPSR
jgi:uncharacterized integral membrane protein